MLNDSEDFLAEINYEKDRNEKFSAAITEGCDEEEEELSAAEVLKRLQTAWLNERMSPEILQPETEIVEVILAQMTQMKENLDQRVDKTDYRVPLHQMELARVRFLISSYLRCRLRKIQDFVLSMNLEEETQLKMKLTKDEIAFARSYRENLVDITQTTILKKMPGHLANELDPNKAPAKELGSGYPAPDLDSSVFIKVSKDVYGVLLQDETLQDKDEEVDLEVGSQHVLKYKSVAHLVKNGSVVLIW